MNWNARYAIGKSLRLPKGVYTTPQDKPEGKNFEEWYQSGDIKNMYFIRHPKNNAIRWALTPAKLSSQPSTHTMKLRIFTPSNSVPLHKLLPIFKSRVNIQDPQQLEHFDEQQWDTNDANGLLTVSPKRAHSHNHAIMSGTYEQPDKMVRIYRHVPDEVDTIRHGQLVTTDPMRAMAVGLRAAHLVEEEGQYYDRFPGHILTAQVPAKHLRSELQGQGNHITRWADYGYVPEGNCDTNVGLTESYVRMAIGTAKEMKKLREVL